MAKTKKKKASDYRGNAKHYTEGRLLDKVQSVPKSAGRAIVEKALLLRQLLASPEVPGWAKALVVGVLGYFILPLDAVPDFVPVLGYADDFAAMLLVLAELNMYATPEMEREARAALPDVLRD
jgi:uncharacterized membrane protein YkvA (DUF1232 family)